MIKFTDIELTEKKSELKKENIFENDWVGESSFNSCNVLVCLKMF